MLLTSKSTWPAPTAAMAPGVGGRPKRVAYLAWLAIAIAMTTIGAAKAGDEPHLFTHQSYVDDVLRPKSLPVGDIKAMFAWVLGQLPDRVKVYPTENYFYFKFVANRTQYAGNIRLDASNRDEGKVHFAYFEDLGEWKREPPVKHMLMGAEQGVKVEKVEKLLYRITLGEKSVLFELNDLTGVAPPAKIIGKDEVYIGPIFDDAAIRFFLIYNTRLKIFHYVLDETVPVGELMTRSTLTPRILIGRRTGFAYYRDHKLERKLLIGVFEGNARVNNYFDGPFDQMPDNFLEGDALSKRIIEVEPSLAGKIDRFGGSPGGASRYMIAPYLHYSTEDELAVFHECATSKEVPAERYPECFVIEGYEGEGSGEEATGDEQPEAKAKSGKKKSGKNKAD